MILTKRPKPLSIWACAARQYQLKTFRWRKAEQRRRSQSADRAFAAVVAGGPLKLPTKGAP